jgi:broad specificity phosphatase PhoE
VTDVGVLLLVRHGQGSLGTSNYDELSELGHRQSRPAAPESRLALQSALDEAIGRWIQGGAGYPEPHSAFIARVEAVVAELTALPGTTMAVTSAGVIAVACARFTGLPADRWPALARVVVNTSVTRLITGRTGTHLLTFNDHAHLEGDRSLITYR